ncbi:hypothetical protein C4D60_Mb05t01140 [Musa balbisiana]|uniref:Uncharacterized protein n=1 Tax=Musa balbisiana TaxID=52838 RepID=A0A4S8JST9_MUSBA|nr:hypothetical protein C4D60_Mb05t01140 [Musa balbisiana]
MLQLQAQDLVGCPQSCATNKFNKAISNRTPCFLRRTIAMPVSRFCPMDCTKLFDIPTASSSSLPLSSHCKFVSTGWTAIEERP